MSFNQFLKQFSVSLPLELRLENHIYNIADNLINGYNGGKWRTTKIGGMVTLVIPDDSKAITLNNPLSGVSVTTDRKTANLIFTFLTVHWFWERYNEALSDASQEFIAVYVQGLKNAVYDGSATVDKQAFFKFTD